MSHYIALSAVGMCSLRNRIFSWLPMSGARSGGAVMITIGRGGNGVTSSTHSFTTYHSFRSHISHFGSVLYRWQFSRIFMASREPVDENWFWTVRGYSHQFAAHIATKPCGRLFKVLFRVITIIFMYGRYGLRAKDL